jgi:hypothetical protein
MEKHLGKCFVCVATNANSEQEVVTQHRGTPLCAVHAKAVFEKAADDLRELKSAEFRDRK